MLLHECKITVQKNTIRKGMSPEYKFHELINSFLTLGTTAGCFTTTFHIGFMPKSVHFSTGPSSQLLHPSFSLNQVRSQGD